MLTTLQNPRNCPYLHALVFVLLVSWIATLVSTTCQMPSTWRDAMPSGCSTPDSHAHQPLGHAPNPIHDCSLKPCADAPPNPAFQFKIIQPDLPVFVLCLIGLIGGLFRRLPSPRIPRATDPPDGRRVPLIYRFCTLLN